MQFFTNEECADWLTGHGQANLLAEIKGPRKEAEPSMGGPLTTIPKLYPFCRILEEVLQPYEKLLMWVTLSGVWHSSENWHLYYRMRESYGDWRLLEDAPGHLFHQHEASDLRSFMMMSLVNGWDVHFLPWPEYGRAFFSHDEYWEATFSNDQSVATATEALESFF